MCTIYGVLSHFTLFCRQISSVEMRKALYEFFSSSETGDFTFYMTIIRRQNVAQKCSDYCQIPPSMT